MFFWVPYFPYFLLTPIFKKLDAFIPALSLLAKFTFLAIFVSYPQQKQQET